jgi:hypothetical protein
MSRRVNWEWPARHPGAAIGVAAAVTAVAVFGMTRLRFHADLSELVPRGVRSAAALHRFQEGFADAEPVTALVEGEDPATVARAADRLAARLGKSRLVKAASATLDRSAAPIGPGDVWRLLDEPGLLRARERMAPAAIDASVARMRAILLQPGGGALSRIVADDPLGLRALLVASYERLGAGLSVEPLTGRLASADGRAVAVIVRPAGSPFDAPFVDRFSRTIDSAARATSRGEARIRFTGPHVVAHDTKRMIQGDLARSSIVSLLGIATVLFVAFGRLRAAVLLAVPLVVGSLWTVGVAGLALPGLSAISVAFAAIVLGLGDDASVHLLAHATAARREGHGPLEATEQALREVAPAAVAAAATACIALGSLGASSFRALRELGLLAAVGVVSTFGVAWLVLGATLARSAKPIAVRAGLLEGALARLGRLAHERRRLFLGVAAVVTISAGVLGLPAFAERVVAVRPSRMPALQVQTDLFRRFGGTPGQWVALQEAPDLEHALLASERLAAALTKLERRGLLDGFDSITALHPSRRTQVARLARWKSLPLERAARDLDASLAAHGFARAPFEPALRLLRSPPADPGPIVESGDLFERRHLAREKGRRLVATYLRPSAAADLDRLANAIRRAVPGTHLTGYPLLEHEVRALLPRDLGRVGAIALCLVLVTLALHFRRARPVVVSFVGLWVGLSLLLLGLHAAGVRWTAYNLVVLPVLVGISVDENVFFVEAWLRAEGDAGERTARATSGAGRAILTTSSTTLVGFAALLACDFDGLRQLGTAAALGIAACMVASLVVTPALASALLTKSR